MRTLLSLLLLFPAAIFAQTISLNPSSQAYAPITCPLPVAGYFYTYGTTTGLVSGTDSVDIYVDYGDGNDSLHRVPVYNNSTSTQYFYWSQAQHQYQAAGIFTVTMIATIPSTTISDTLVYTNAIVATNTCNNVTGRIYRDNNSNCVYDPGDDSIPYQYIALREINSTGGWYTSANSAGFYQASVYNGGTYQVIPVFNMISPPMSCSQNDTATFTATGSDVIDFPLAPVTIIHAAQITDSSGSRCYGTGDVAVNGYANSYGNGSITSLQIYIAFGDGHDTTFSSPMWNSSCFQSNYFWMTHHYAAPGTYSLLLAVTDPVSGASDTLINYNDVDLQDSCGNITGHVYLDDDNSCSYTAGDDSIPYAYVHLLQNNQYVAGDFAGNSGGYAFYVPPGNYTVEIGNYINTYGYQMVCSTTTSRTVTVAPSGSVTEDFGMTCNTSGDAAAALYGNSFRPGMQAYVYPWITNLTCAPQSGTATLILDPQTTFAGSCDSTVSFTASGNTVTWSYSNITPYTWWYAWLHCIILDVDSSAQVGDSLCFTFYLTPSPADANASNDTVHICFPVLNSWDPNFKEVSPAGPAANGHVAPNTEMTYTIHFQNTGNDVAYNIAITDTIDPSLDMSTLQVIGSSHPVDPDILGSNVVRFNFHNINLPDSASNEPQSHGWVTYRITQDQWLPDGTQFDNTAYIYFDFNEAIVTNTTVSIVDWALSINEVSVSGNLDVFPIPANDYITVSSANAFSGQIVLRDVSGREVRSQNMNGTETRLFTGDLANGVYFISLSSEGRTLTRKVIVQH